jgi:ferric-dicitrate binding protein FerR (iron transport regulator)
MSCKQFQPIFDAIIDGSLTAQQKRQLESHIETCADCRQAYQTHCTMETVIGECFTLPGPSDEITQSIRNRIANTKPAASPAPIWARGTFTKIAAGILLLAALGLGFAAGRYPSVASSIDAAPTAYSVQSVQGTVLVRHLGAKTWLPLATDSTMFVGDELVSAPNAKATFVVGENSTITLSENSMLVLKTVGETTELYLASGCLDAALESPHGPFFVTTPHGRAEALGTEFTVHVQ